MTSRLLTACATVAMLVSATVASAATPLIDAVKSGDVAAVRVLLRQRVDVNAAGPDGATPLHWAVQRGDAALVDQLLKAGAKVNVPNRYGVVPLRLAADRGNAVIAEALLNAGADANAANAEGQTVLMAASRTGNVQLVTTLLAHGANVNAVESWQDETALMMAAAENHAEVVTALIEGGADKNAKSRTLDGAPPRQRVAPDQGQQGVHVTFPKGGLTALHFAARQNAPAAAAALADAGANLDVKDPDGFTPTLLAILSGNFDVAALLIEKGAGIDTVDASGRTPLFAAVDLNSYEYSYNRPTPKPTGKMSPVDLVKFLLAHKANVNARLTDRVRPPKYDQAGNPNLTAGATPFLKAASTSDHALMRILLDAGADPFARNSQHTNALMMTAGLNWRRIGSLGSEADAIEAMRILLDLGLDINAFNDLGQTALHGAMMRGYGAERGDQEGVSTVPSLNVIKFLVEHGARLDAKDKAGRTPVDIAAAVGNDEAVEYFKSLKR